MQKTRHGFQAFFFLAAAVITVRSLAGFSKATIESWCPGGGIESLAFYLKNQAFLCATSGINLLLFLALVVGTLVAGRAFCSWVCPIGTIHEVLAWAGGTAGIRSETVWRGGWKHLGLIRYPVLVLILWATMTNADLILRPFCPYYVGLAGQEHEVAWWSKWLMLGLAFGALALPFLWCRLFCPLGATLGILRKASPVAPTINPDRCTSCGSCSEQCPQQIQVHEVRRVWSSDCTSCQVCTDVCPHRAIAMKAGYRIPAPGAVSDRHKRFGLSKRFISWSVAAMMLAGVVAAWNIPMPTFSKSFALFGKTPATATVEMIVNGLRCRGTALTFAWILEQEEGVLSVDAFVAEHRARIVYDPARTRPEAIKALIQDGRQSTDRRTGVKKLVRPFTVEEILP
ncbi:MAG TPA: 4Fe-4S binding protein [Candidatus Ozemobacteraceae bacterium]|nr:4Fe-4S binding protein [Candidatus Ozemobacteraceae bacterium]